MESTKRAIRYQWSNIKKDILEFWAVVLFINIAIFFINIKFSKLNIHIGISNGIEKGMSFSFISINIFIILITLIVNSYNKFYEDFPICISFSMTRRDFFRSLIVNNLLTASIFALVQGLLMKMDPILVRALDENPIYDFGLFNIETDSIVYIIFSLFVLFLITSSIWSLIASLNYRFRSKVWIAFLIIFVLGEKIFSLIDVFSLDNLLDNRLDVGELMVYSVVMLAIYTFIYIVTINSNVRNDIN